MNLKENIVIIIEFGNTNEILGNVRNVQEMA